MYTEESQASVHVGKAGTGKTTWLTSNGFAYVGDFSNKLGLSGCIYYNAEKDRVALETQCLESSDCLRFLQVFPSVKVKQYLHSYL